MDAFSNSPRYEFYTEVFKTKGPSPIRDKECPCCHEEIQDTDETLSHLDGKCQNAFHMECFVTWIHQSLEQNAQNADQPDDYDPGLPSCPMCCRLLGEERDIHLGEGELIEGRSGHYELRWQGKIDFIQNTVEDEVGNYVEWPLRMEMGRYTGHIVNEATESIEQGARPGQVYDDTMYKLNFLEEHFVNFIINMGDEIRARFRESVAELGPEFDFS